MRHLTGLAAAGQGLAFRYYTLAAGYTLRRRSMSPAAGVAGPAVLRLFELLQSVLPAGGL